MARKICVGMTVTNGLVQAVVFDTLQAADVPAPAGVLLAANNLSDLANAGTSRTNLGVPAGSGNCSGTNTGDQTDATLSFTDITTNDVSTSKHGFAPKAPNDATKFLNGMGAYAVPAGGGSITNHIALASADTSIGVASWTDATGCSISCTAGTWLFLAGAQARNNGSTSTCGAKIYYGSTDIVSCEAAIPSSTANLPFSLFMIAVLGSTQTVKLAGNSDGGTMVFKRYGDYDMGAANIPGTYLLAIQLG